VDSQAKKKKKKLKKKLKKKKKAYMAEQNKNIKWGKWEKK